jgi:hypothetical protein
VIDSYPISVCDNYRIKHSKIRQGEDWRGYIPSKKLFYGVRIHTLVTEQGESDPLPVFVPLSKLVQPVRSEQVG